MFTIMHRSADRSGENLSNKEFVSISLLADKDTQILVNVKHNNFYLQLFCKILKMLRFSDFFMNQDMFYLNYINLL